MNKLYLFLAFAAFAVLACSDDKKDPSHQEHCGKTPKPKECLAGNWRLSEVKDDYGTNRDCNSTGNLNLSSQGEYSFSGANGEFNGEWDLESNNKIQINCMINCNDAADYIISPEFAVKNDGNILEVSSVGYSSFSRCKINNARKLTEVFQWVGN